MSSRMTVILDVTVPIFDGKSQISCRIRGLSTCLLGRIWGRSGRSGNGSCRVPSLQGSPCLVVGHVNTDCPLLKESTESTWNKNFSVRVLGTIGHSLSSCLQTLYVLVLGSGEGTTDHCGTRWYLPEFVFLLGFLS